jgi:hypothetical protein
MAMLWDILSELETLADNYPDSDAQELYDRLCEAKDEIASALRDIAYFYARRHHEVSDDDIDDAEVI